MYLRDLSVYASDAAQLRPPHDAGAFNLGAHAPVEAFLDLLPRRQVWLGDLAKVNIVVGPRPDGVPMVFSALNVAIVAWPWFDFARYFALDRSAQQRRIVGVLHRALCRVARRVDAPTHWYDAAYRTLSDGPFPLPELSERELERRWGMSRFRGAGRKSQGKRRPV